MQGTVRGVGEQERLARELAASEERYRFLVENSPDVVFATDRDGMFTYLSEAIERLTGFTAAELTHRHFSTVVDPSSTGLAADRWEKLIADPSSEQVSELVLIGKDDRDDARRDPRDRHHAPTTGPSRASTAPRATSPSASASSASCARPRSAIAISSRRRRTSSG